VPRITGNGGFRPAADVAKPTEAWLFVARVERSDTRGFSRDIEQLMCRFEQCVEYEQGTQSDDKRCGIVEMSRRAPGVATLYPGYISCTRCFDPVSPANPLISMNRRPYCFICQYGVAGSCDPVRSSLPHSIRNPYALFIPSPRRAGWLHGDRPHRQRLQCDAVPWRRHPDCAQRPRRHNLPQSRHLPASGHAV
jgi:hypothetical protein